MDDPADQKYHTFVLHTHLSRTCCEDIPTPMHQIPPHCHKPPNQQCATASKSPCHEFHHMTLNTCIPHHTITNRETRNALATSTAAHKSRFSSLSNTLCNGIRGYLVSKWFLFAKSTNCVSSFLPAYVYLGNCAAVLFGMLCCFRAVCCFRV